MICHSQIKEGRTLTGSPSASTWDVIWLRGVDLNHRPLGYEPNELPGCSTPQLKTNRAFSAGQMGHSAPACSFLNLEMALRRRFLRGSTRNVSASAGPSRDSCVPTSLHKNQEI